MGAPYALSSDLVSAWPAKSLEVAQYIDGQVPLIAMTQNAQTGTSYSLTATDFTKLVTLSNASPVTVTVPLESSVAWVAGTQLRLMNLGAGVVTVAGAVGVTINGSPLTLAQYKNATLTKTGTNTWTFNGSSAAPGMDLITPTSVAGSGVTLSGGQVSFTAATAVSVNGCFTTTYDNYLLRFNGVSSADTNCTLRMRASGTDNSAASYGYSLLQGVSGAASSSQATGQTSVQQALINTEGFHAAIDVYSPALAANTRFQSNGGKNTGTPYLAAFLGFHAVASAFDGLTVLPASGNITGSLRIYGLRNS